jgi:hypothetical protein
VLIILLGNTLAVVSCSKWDRTEQTEKKLSLKNEPIQNTEIPPERVKQLMNLGYFDRAPTHNPEARSVTKRNPKAFDGVNLYSSRHRAEALLIDNNGKVLHKWHASRQKPSWVHTELLPNGDLLAISKLHSLAKYDWSSKLLWQQSLAAHHDLDIGSDGTIFLLTSSIREIEYDDVLIPILTNAITTLTSTGRFIKKTQLFPAMGSLIPERRLKRIKSTFAQGYKRRDLFQESTSTDVFHTNSVQIIHKDVPNIASRGSILLSVRELNRIVIVDHSMTRLLWSWGVGELEEQHHATLLANGNIMVFDNGIRRKQSRVVELNPATKKIEWSFTQPNFYTRLRGAAQKLPNDNVLITESDKGHAFEITPTGKIVWEFWNPDVIDEEPPTRAIIYRMTRYEKNYLDEGLLE